MIYYKAVCGKHNWESPGLYKTEASALKSAQAHRNSVTGPHQIEILEIYIPDKAMQVRSKNAQ
jgi:hypothetical protein